MTCDGRCDRRLAPVTGLSRNLSSPQHSRKSEHMLTIHVDIQQTEVVNAVAGDITTSLAIGAVELRNVHAWRSVYGARLITP
jgi:hypothetical protein